MAAHWGAFPTKGEEHKATSKHATPIMRRLTDRNTGKKYNVPEDDYNMFVKFIKGQGINQSVEDYITSVFDTYEAPEDKQYKQVYPSEYLQGGKGAEFAVPGCGHIKFLEYKQSMLKVTFWNDEACVYADVPTSVAGQLKYLAESKVDQISSVDGKRRHVLGMRFWDLVRVRGTVSGSQYPFKYAEASKAATAVDTGYANEPDWTTGKYVFLPTSSGKYVRRNVGELNSYQKRDIEESRAFAKQDAPSSASDAKRSIEHMFNTINALQMKDPAAKRGILQQMESMKDDEAALRNYLGILGLYF